MVGLSLEFTGGAEGKTVSEARLFELDAVGPPSVPLLSFASFLFSAVDGQSLIRCSKEAQNLHLMGRLP
jgi:hypothetical protein